MQYSRHGAAKAWLHSLFSHFIDVSSWLFDPVFGRKRGRRSLNLIAATIEACL